MKLTNPHELVLKGALAELSKEDREYIMETSKKIMRKIHKIPNSYMKGFVGMQVMIEISNMVNEIE